MVNIYIFLKFLLEVQGDLFNKLNVIKCVDLAELIMRLNIGFDNIIRILVA